MKSSAGHHFVGLDHVRAFAAFMVVCWHFGHAASPESIGTGPALAFLDEGHTGVALFMVLSGFLFAKLLNGSRLLVLPFLWNRLLRLVPLLILVLALHGITRFSEGVGPLEYLRTTLAGFVFPTLLRKGTWSVAVELHFYLLLPLLLWLTRKWVPGMALLIAVALLVRLNLYHIDPEFQTIVFRTIVGRGDQFICGMLAFHYARLVTGRVALVTLGAFLFGYTVFDLAGGYYRLPEDLRWVWIVLPTFEGVSYAVLIAWYDRNPITMPKISKCLEMTGVYSYSIYLLHFLFFVSAANAVNDYVMPLPNFYLALPWTFAFFCIMVAIGHLSFKFIEAPFLRYRKPYILTVEAGDQRTWAPTFVSDAKRTLARLRSSSRLPAPRVVGQED